MGAVGRRYSRRRPMPVGTTWCRLARQRAAAGVATVRPASVRTPFRHVLTSRAKD
jgi:hypothetical protein